MTAGALHLVALLNQHQEKVVMVWASVSPEVPAGTTVRIRWARFAMLAEKHFCSNPYR
jgi:hypothetical protein